MYDVFNVPACFTQQQRAQKSIEKPAGYENQYCLNTVKSNNAKESSYSRNDAPVNTLLSQSNETEKNKTASLSFQPHKCFIDLKIQDKEKLATTHQAYHQLHSIKISVAKVQSKNETNNSK